MGWASYLNHEGRLCGYAVEATCDFDGCDAKIDRGLSYLCGTQDAISGGGPGCGGYFCEKHMGCVRRTDDGISAQLCDKCKYDPVDAQYFTKEDAEDAESVAS